MRDAPTRSLTKRAAPRIGALLVLLIGTGCARSPLRPDDERTPFDRYRRARNELPKPFLEDEYGRRTPNLRGRLLRPDDE